MTNILKKATFGLWIFLLIMMIAATIIEKLYGTTVSSTYFYGSPFFIGLWIATTLLSLLYIIKRHIIRNKIVYLLHLSFILILSGALTTHIWGIQGNIHLRQGETPVTTFNKK